MVEWEDDLKHGEGTMKHADGCLPTPRCQQAIDGPSLVTEPSIHGALLVGADEEVQFVAEWNNYLT